MSSPAARVTDPHACPVHGGGPILPAGCPTVLVGNLPAARATDLCTCVGPPDTIVAGSPTVLIGGRPAARIGDACAHGGVVIGGDPTVLIGSSFDAAAAGVSRSTPVPFGAYEAPRDLLEAGARLAASRVLIEAQGHVPRYSDGELLDRAQDPITDRYVVRFMEAKYLHARGATDGYGGKLGGPLADTGGIKYWGSTFEDLEDADTDPELIAQKLGIPNFDPNAEYALLILDLQQSGPSAQAQVFAPTYGNMGTFIKSNLSAAFPSDELVDDTLTPEYSEEYANLWADARSQGKDLWSARDQEALLESMPDDEARDQFATRFAIHSTIGANDAFLGTGLTKSLGGEQKYGVVETFVFDPQPKTIRQLSEAGQTVFLEKGQLQRIPRS